MNKRLKRFFPLTKFLVAPLLGFATLAACAGGDGKPSSDSDRKLPSASVRTYKYVGSVQCTGGGTSLTEMQRQLTDAGIQVLTATCGVDGNLYAAVCGGADGGIGIFKVPTQQAEAASALGFAPLSTLPAARVVPCTLPSASVRTYKYVGSVQCSGGGTSLTEMQRQLTDTGIQVLTATCGVDGNLYAAVCGGADGRIGIIDVPAHQSQAASALGFLPLSTLPTATEVPCQ